MTSVIDRTAARPAATTSAAETGLSGPGRRRFLATSAAATAAAFAAPKVSAQLTTGNPLQQAPANCTTVPDTPTPVRPDPQDASRVFSAGESVLAFRNHGMQAEFLREALTPLGAHYLLIHFDVPQLSAQGYSVALDGRVRNPTRLSLDDLKRRTLIQQVVTLECAGTGRSTLHPRAVYVPWFKEALGQYQWTGTPLRQILEQAGVLDDAVEVLFTGWDSGVDLGVEHAFERSLPIKEALRDEVMLAWEHNGVPLLPQHGFPLRLVVPSWYGMASVKWLRAITVLNQPFRGVQQSKVYRYQQVKGEAGEPVTFKRVHSLITPPGVPDLITRHRFLAPGPVTLQGVAWSGAGRITRVEVSTDDTATWREARLVPVSGDRFAWTQWQIDWSASAGEHILACRATDEAGDVQLVNPENRWNRQGMGVNGVQRVHVRVLEGIGSARGPVPSAARVVVPGADPVEVPQTVNALAGRGS
ncbi:MULTISPECIES: sulfite oxidase [Ramlibacter]|uniref:Molybdopterin-dependent oxidoreductase n=1 Tax=Ramlibacter pinisoli TaxID=2682844 RepID=A0A6N8IQR3_9BURK|nr:MULTISPECIES: sulfite oxidase [Ramlibacter]MBA2964222.1 sulfite oxidase [Ramlibacter sp. CGMCC 1.13660]MVQ29188.1 molybdopterin-dependent oxidoreductase [Ramlibacter pinisoli]